MLVQHPPLLPLLQSLQNRVVPELQMHEHMEALRGPLEQFPRHVQREKELEAANTNPAKSRRPRTKREERPNWEAVGVYSVEQLTIWH